MFKKLLAMAVLVSSSLAFAAVDLNKAGPAELDSIKGIGPAMSVKILDERKKGSFKDWNDFIDRVKGVGQANAVKFSKAGLTVGGMAYKVGAAPLPTPASVAAIKGSQTAKPAAKAAASAAK